MGICISYNGSLSDPSTLDELIREVRKFCSRVGWKCKDYSEHYSGVVILTQAQIFGGASPEDRDPEPWPDTGEKFYGIRARVSKLRPPPLIEETVRGIVVSPPGTESVLLLFDQKGRLTRYTDLPPVMVINAMPDTNHYMALSFFTKTSGEPASHVGICVLLRMLKQKFMPNLEVSDDTKFWKTWNIDSLNLRHKEMGALLGVFRESKDLGGLLQKLGVDLPKGGKIKQLDPRLDMPGGTKEKKKTRLN